MSVGVSVPARPATSAPTPLDGNGTASGSRIRPLGLLPQIAAVIAVFIIGIRLQIGQGVTAGHLVALLLCPVWIPVLKRYWGARTLLTTAVLAAVAGIWLTRSAVADHATTTLNLVSNTSLLVGTLCGIGVILWARTVLPDSLVGGVFGVGMLYAVLHANPSGLTNAWKFGFAIPVAIVVLSLVGGGGGRRLPAFVALLALGAASVLQDSRSYFAEFLVAAILVVWQGRPWRFGRRASASVTVIVIIAVAFLVYDAGTSLFVGGYLGEAAQARSVAQVDASGSLLLGGRPELAAAAALFAYHPWGFGAGVLPSDEDLHVAKTGMASINYNPNNGYVDNFMFGSKFELHSVLSDTWAYFGIVGILLVALILFLLLRALGVTISRGTASGLLVFLCIYSIWNLFFSPLYGSAPALIITLGLCLVVRKPHRRADGLAFGRSE